MHFLIVGGGIAGVSALEELIRMLHDNETENAGKSDGDRGSTSSSPSASSTRHRVTLLHESSLLHRIAHSEQRTRALEEVTHIESVAAEEWAQRLTQQSESKIEIGVVRGRMCGLNASEKKISYIPAHPTDGQSSLSRPITSPSSSLHYDRLLVCTGSRPRPFIHLSPAESSALPELITIRDADSIARLAHELCTPVRLMPSDGEQSIRPKRVAIIGGGGIAMELVHAIRTSQFQAINATDAVARTGDDNMQEAEGKRVEPAMVGSVSLTLPPLEVEWCVREQHIGKPFLDRMGAAFIMPELFEERHETDMNDDGGMEEKSNQHDAKGQKTPRDKQHDGRSAAARPNVSFAKRVHIAPATTKPIVKTQLRVFDPHVAAAIRAATSNDASSSAGSASTSMHVLSSSRSEPKPSSASIAAPDSTFAAGPGPALGPNWLNQLHIDTNIPKYVMERERERKRKEQKAGESVEEATKDEGQTTTHDGDVSMSVDSTSSSSRHIDLSLRLRVGVAELHRLSSLSPASATSNSDACVAPPYPLALVLTDGTRIECDMVVSATGVRPNTDWAPPELHVGSDGGILVDECLRSSVKDIWAAGDCASLAFSRAYMEMNHPDPLRPALFPGGFVLDCNDDTQGSDPDQQTRVVLLRELSATTTAPSGSPAPTLSPSPSPTLTPSPSPLSSSPSFAPIVWSPQRLWTFAKHSSLFAARSMSGVWDKELSEAGGFDWMLFAHTTVLAGFKVVLLGQYNMQGFTQTLRKVWEQEPIDSGVRNEMDVGSESQQTTVIPRLRTLVRLHPGVELIKLHLLDGRVIGAMLIGASDSSAIELEETMENLMLNQLDLTQFGDFLNDVDVDIADFFD